MGITLLIFGVFMLVFFLLKFSNSVDSFPQLEGGGGGGDVAVNFGDSNFGMGTNFNSEDPASSVSESNPEEPEEQEQILISDNANAAAITESKKPTKKKEITEVPKKPEMPKPSKSAVEALNNVLSGKNESGDGPDKVAGNKGKANGSAANRGYNGGGGEGTGQGGGNGDGEGPGNGSGKGTGSGNGNGSGSGDYQLTGRKPLSKPEPKYPCQEEGKVAVEITVDKNGKVINAVAGQRGTTNTAACLKQAAEIAAKNTRFEANPSAPDKQVGKIIYDFKLRASNL